MTQIERVEKYVEATRIGNVEHYDMHYGEINELYELARKDLWRAFSLVFKYGRAKGYRAARAMQRS